MPCCALIKNGPGDVQTATSHHAGRSGKMIMSAALPVGVSPIPLVKKSPMVIRNSTHTQMYRLLMARRTAKVTTWTGHSQLHTYVCTCMLAFMYAHTCRHTHTHVCMHTCMHTRLQAHTHTHSHMRIWTHTHIHTHTCAHTHTRAHKHIHKHTHKHTATTPHRQNADSQKHCKDQTPGHQELHTHTHTHTHTKLK